MNRLGLLDPNSTEVDAHASSNGMAIMREVLTMIGPTADYENRGPSLPLAVREWCINSPGVNPATNSVFMHSEDGRLYRWNLVTNSLDQFVNLNIGIGEPYVPNIIGPDGTVFTLNGRFDVAAYAAPHSDLVALMILAHQAHLHNLISRVICGKS